MKRAKKKVARKPARKVAKKKAKPRKKATRRVAKKAARPKKKVARPARKIAKRAKRTVPKRRSAPKLKVAPRRPVGRTKEGRGPARTAHPRLKVVPRPRAPKAPPLAAPRPAPEPRAFAEAKATASAKDLVLFELVRARVAVAAAIQGMSAGSAEVPTGDGKWSTREMVLHLSFWDRECLPLLENAYQHGKGSGLTHEDIERRNPAGLEELRHHDWDSARRLLQLHRERLMEEFQSIPEEPAEMWSKEHPVGKLARILTHHDRHHADQLKAARTSRGE